MHIKVIGYRTKELKLADNLSQIRSNRENGAKGFSLSEVRTILTKTIKDVEKNKNLT